MGLVVGAARRAKDLVLKGLEVERQEEFTAFIQTGVNQISS